MHPVFPHRTLPRPKKPPKLPKRTENKHAPTYPPPPPNNNTLRTKLPHIKREPKHPLSSNRNINSPNRTPKNLPEPQPPNSLAAGKNSTQKQHGKTRGPRRGRVQAERLLELDGLHLPARLSQCGHGRLRLLARRRARRAHARGGRDATYVSRISSMVALQGN